MIFLTGSVGPELEHSTLFDTAPLGLMIQPDAKYRRFIPRVRWWAADNGCFARGVTFDADAWHDWLVGLPRERCLFATAPDVVGDAAATWERSAPWLPRIRQAGFPAAFAAQDGQESLPVPWSAFDVLFVGGSTRWKESMAAAELAQAAAAHGKWVHVGRVNFLRRMRLVAPFADSIDGTRLKYGADANLPQLLAALRWVNTQQRLFG